MLEIMPDGLPKTEIDARLKEFKARIRRLTIQREEEWQVAKALRLIGYTGEEAKSWLNRYHIASRELKRVLYWVDYWEKVRLDIAYDIEGAQDMIDIDNAKHISTWAELHKTIDNPKTNAESNKKFYAKWNKKCKDIVLPELPLPKKEDALKIITDYISLLTHQAEMYWLERNDYVAEQNWNLATRAVNDWKRVRNRLESIGLLMTQRTGTFK